MSKLRANLLLSVVKATCVLGLSFESGMALANEAQAEKDKDKKLAYVNHQSLVLEEGEKITKFFTPKELLEHGRFQVRIKRPKAAEPVEPAKPKEPTLAEKVEARRLMHDANQAYFKGEISKAWELVEKAEQLDSSSYLVKTMKGSLLYKIGSYDLALEIWEESLKQNPNQPEIIEVMNQLASKVKQTPPVANKNADETSKMKDKVQ